MRIEVPLFLRGEDIFGKSLWRTKILGDFVGKTGGLLEGARSLHIL